MEMEERKEAAKRSSRGDQVKANDYYGRLCIAPTWQSAARQIRYAGVDGRHSGRESHRTSLALVHELAVTDDERRLLTSGLSSESGRTSSVPTCERRVPAFDVQRIP